MINSNASRAEKDKGYRKQDLGLTYSPAESGFKVWAPAASAVSLVLYETDGHGGEEHEGRLYYMRREELSGVWYVTLTGDQKGKFYMYRAVYSDGTIRETADPYAVAVSANGTRTAIVDMRETDPEGWDTDSGPEAGHPADAVLYELHVRDFSAHPSSGLRHKGLYKAFTETGVTDAGGRPLGIGHLSELGVTHVHLLPVFDFHTVDELHGEGVPLEGAEFTGYNWGYDPQHYNVPEGSYSTNPREPKTRIREFKEMVQSFHAHGIAVVMDVVYNHTYSVEHGPFEALAPGYFYRHDYAGRLSNGSGVGNELATERPMVRKYIKDSLRHWAREYHIDGFRFDLMGLMDSVTMREIAEELRQELNHPGLILYGEPWTGGDSPLMDKTLKGVQRGKGYAVFNDHFRSAVKGDSDGWGKGFATGEQNREHAVMTGIAGAIGDFTDSPGETVNYVTAHDNLNLWDKLLAVGGMKEQARLPEMDNGRLRGGGDLRAAIQLANPYHGLDEADPLEDEQVRRSLLANGIVLTSQGIPFLHAGDELLRSKFGDHNSYRSGDEINAIRWDNKARFQPVYDYYKGLIGLRRSHPAFRMRGKQEIERSLHVLRCGGGMVAYRLGNHAGGDAWRNIIVAFNANPWPETLAVPHSECGWQVVADHTAAGTSVLRSIDGTAVTVQGLSMLVLYDREEAAPPRAKTVEVHYERPDRKYAGWNLWVWGTGIQDGQISFTRLEDGRAVASIEVEPGRERIGYILRLNDWESREGEGDRHIVCRGDETAKLLIRSAESSRQIREVPLRPTS